MGEGKKMNAVLGTEMTTRLKGLRSDLCQHRDIADSLVKEIDKVLTNGTSRNPTLHSKPASLLKAASQKAKPISLAAPNLKPRRSRTGIIQNVLKLLVRGRYSTPELLKELEAEGQAVKGKRPIQTLYGILHKDMKSSNPRVTRTKDGHWQIIRTN
jgi:hypothetical protein